ncbi:hypothetical protein Tco_0598695 [Tanacetum coccineum]
MKEAVDVTIQLQTNKLREEAQAENQEFLNQIDSTMKAIIKEHVQAQVSKSMPNRLRKFELKKILIDKMETNKSIDKLDTQKNLYNALVESYNTDKDIITSYDDVVTLKRGRDDQDKDEDPFADQTEGRREGNQSKKPSKSAHAEDHDQKAADLEDQPHQEFNTGNEDVSPVREALNEDVTKELYADVNVDLVNEDTEMTNADQVHDTQKADEPVQSSSVSFDFTSKLLNLKNPSPTDNEIASLIETSSRHATAVPKNTFGFTITIPPPPPFFNPLQQEATTTPTPITSETTTSLPTLPDFASYAQALSSIPSIVDRYMDNKLREAINKSILAHNLDCRQEAQDEKNAYIELVDTSMRALIKEEVNTQSRIRFYNSGDREKCHRICRNCNLDKTRISQVTRDEEPPTSFDELNDTSFDFSAFVLNRLKIPNLTQEILVRPAFNLLKGTCKSITELEYHLEECSKATTERLDWHNPENKPYSFDLRKPLSLIQDHRGRQIIPKDCFINKDLEYLKGGEFSRRYSTSVTKTKAATYDLKGIEDLVQELWSPVQMYDYSHLEEIEIRRDDQKLYTFKEGDFKRLRLQDIKDMLFLLVQQKLTNLTIDERYQKKLNLTKPDTVKSNLRQRTAYTAYSDPKGVIYKDQMNRNRLMRAYRLHKFSDGMLDDVRSSLNDIAKGIRMDCLPMRRWSNLDNKRARVMVQDIDKQLYQRRLMRNLEKFIGGREYRKDLRLLERTI